MLIGFETREVAGIEKLAIGLRSVDLESFIAKNKDELDLIEKIYPFTKFNIFVGPNASGKSSLLKSLYLLKELFSIKEKEERVVNNILCHKRTQEKTKPIRWTCFFYLQALDNFVRYDLDLELISEVEEIEATKRSDCIFPQVKILAEYIRFDKSDEVLKGLCLGRKRKSIKNKILEKVEKREDKENIENSQEKNKGEQFASSNSLKNIFSIYRSANTLEISKPETSRVKINIASSEVNCKLVLPVLVSENENSEIRQVFGDEIECLNLLKKEVQGIVVDFDFDDEEEWKALRDYDLESIYTNFKNFNFEDSRHMNFLSKIFAVFTDTEANNKVNKDVYYVLNKDTERKSNKGRCLLDKLNYLSASEKRAILIILKVLNSENKIIAVDSPDLNLYHENVNILADMLCKLILNSDKQIFITSHFPYFLDHFSLKEIWNFSQENEITEEDKEHGIDRRPYCLAQDNLLDEMAKEGIAISQLWYGQYF